MKGHTIHWSRDRFLDGAFQWCRVLVVALSVVLDAAGFLLPTYVNERGACLVHCTAPWWQQWWHWFQRRLSISPFQIMTQIRKPHLIERSSPQPPVVSSSNIQQFYARGPYWSRTTSRYPSLSFWCPSLLVAWTGCPDTIHIFSVLYYVGWGRPFLDFVVRGSQAQIVASFVWASAWFWRHIGNPCPRMRCPKLPFWSGCIYIEHCDT